jgi:chemotaxis protein methyltransferase CheR
VNCPVTRHDLERFRAAITREIGLQFDDAKLGFLGEVMQRRLDKLGRSGDAYLRGLKREPWQGEFTALAQELTIGETYFFRNNEQFLALAEVALPERMRVNRTSSTGSPKTLRLLSAGCASGEEAYSIAMVARATVADPSFNVLIRAVDLNPNVLEKAARARYSSRALRDTPPDILRQWFRPDGREMVLEETLRAAVKFHAGNLASDDPQLWQPGAYDVIFCRNVLMYFAPEQMRAAIARIAQALAPGGFLFLGHAETLRGVSDEFHLRHTHGTFYYERREKSDPADRQPMPSVPKPLPAVAPVAALGAPAGAPLGTAWFDEIRQATERVAALVPAPAAVNTPSELPSSFWNVAPALDLLRQERFAEALDYVRGGPKGAGPDPDVLLLEATLLAHSGQPVAAEDACLRLLQIDELNAGAHYVLALCREHSGGRERACEHDRLAAYLDPAFAMPRLHLGLLARRAGDRDGARRELAQALVLLKREDASRLLLFGGGFNREALLGLCESALRECGGQP